MPTLLTCMFHLNLAFSSLPADRRPEVIRRCYWPLLDLIDATGFPIALEATGWTLEQIAALDPAWIARARELLHGDSAELVGSGYAQCAGPLLPAEVNRRNLQLGQEVYERLFGVRPRLALVCEQAYSPGLVALYAEAGFDAMIADWDNAYRSNPEWGAEVRRLPQRAVGAAGTSLPVIWSESIAFQKFQRYAHDELTLEEYLAFVREAAADGLGAVMLYANDAEVFDHRPGRFAAEPKMAEGEWERVGAALRELREGSIGTPALPSAVLELLDCDGAGLEVTLEAPDQPIPVKKQNKYNISRWAVTGRDDVGLNTRCQRIYERLRDDGVQDAGPWRDLCALWASDFRTHITDDRWEAVLADLDAMERETGAAAPAPAPPAPQASADLAEVVQEGRHWRIRTGPLDVVLNPRRGLAVERLSDARSGPDSVCGTIEHGYFPTIEFGADWYTGDVVQETPLRHKVTDLEPMPPVFGRLGEGVIGAWGRLATELGDVEKLVVVDGEAGTVTIDTTLHWPELPPGSLRAAHLVLDPEAFDPATLFFAAHNGGDELERHVVGGGGAFDHGAPVSALVSSRQGLGVTGGVLLLGDARRHVRMEIDLAVCKPLALVGYTPVGERYFFRAALAVAEGDDTRRGAIDRSAAPQRIRVRLSVVKTDG